MKTGKEIFREIDDYRKENDKTELKKLFKQKYYTYDEIIRALEFLAKTYKQEAKKKN